MAVVNFSDNKMYFNYNVDTSFLQSEKKQKKNLKFCIEKSCVATFVKIFLQYALSACTICVLWVAIKSNLILLNQLNVFVRS